MKNLSKKNKIKNNSILYSLYKLLLSSAFYFKVKPFYFAKDLFLYFKDMRKILKLKNKNFSFKYLYPCLNDRTAQTPLDISYFYQDVWASRKIFELKPSCHLDIGSHAKTVGIISQFTPTTMVDIRPLPVKISGLKFVKGDILKLPFRNNSVESLSSLCVIEHIGLGRYGDEINPNGSEMAVNEIKRVVKKKGIILISLPVFSENIIFFNAHRAFTRDYILELFNGFDLVEEKYIYRNGLVDAYGKDFGTGLFMFCKK